MSLKICIGAAIVVAIWCSVNVECQICTERSYQSKNFNETYMRRQIVTYKRFFRTSTKWQYVPAQKTVTRSVPVTINTCCPGYIRRDENVENELLQCDPICVPACENGVCSSPGVCDCLGGYASDPAHSHACLPQCNGGCDHGKCVAPDQCQCDFAYTLVNSTCQPICTTPCENATCVAPETCQCLPGYRETDRNLCQPYCSAGCDNGVCVAPEVCHCNAGWSNDPNTSFCVPDCDEPCENGKCVAPGMCECDQGYSWSGGRCEPVCSGDCTHGVCISPDVCDCFYGYEWQGTACVCGVECGRGKCISHNHCECDVGYEFIPGLGDGPACVPSCKSCEGLCVAPGVCVFSTTPAVDDVTDAISTSTIDRQTHSPTAHDTVPASDTVGDDATPGGRTSSFSTDYYLLWNMYNDTNAELTTVETRRLDDMAGDPGKSTADRNWALPIGVACGLAALLGAFAIAACFRKQLAIYLKGSSYVVDSKQNENGNAALESQIQNMKFSAILNKKDNIDV